MSKILLSVVAATALAGAALPAAAQPYGGHDHGGYDRGDRYDRGGGYGGIDARQSQIERRIDRGQRTGQLTNREASSLRGEARQIARLEARYRIGGLSGWERNDLDRRLDRLETQVARQTRDGDRYGYGYGPDRGWGPR